MANNYKAKADREYLVRQFKNFLDTLNLKEVGYVEDLKTDGKTAVEAINEIVDTIAHDLSLVRCTSYNEFVLNYKSQHFPTQEEQRPQAYCIDADFIFNDVKYPAGTLIIGTEVIKDTAVSDDTYTFNWFTFEPVNGRIGFLEDLTTENKETLVEAINEHDKEIGDQSTLPEYALNEDGSYTTVFDALKNISNKNRPTDILANTAIHITDSITYEQFNTNTVKLQDVEMYDGAVVSKAYRITNGFTDSNDIYHQAGSIIFATTREINTSLAKYIYTWYVLENVNGKLGDLENLNEKILSDTMVTALNETYKRADDAYKLAERASIDANTALRVNKELSWAEFQADLVNENVEEIEDEDGNKYIVPRLYRIYNDFTLTLDGGITKYYNAGSLVYAWAKDTDGKYIWNYAENADGKIGDTSTLNTYIINDDGTITPKNHDLVEAVNANKQLIGKLEEINTLNLTIGGVEEGFVVCTAMLLQDIINKIGAMSELDEYEKETLMGGLISAIRWIGTKQEQIDGINLPCDDEPKTLLAAVNSLGNWLGDPKIFNGIVGDGTKNLTSILYELTTSEAFNHMQIQDKLSFAEWESTIKNSTTAKKCDAYIITDDFEWVNTDSTKTRYKAGSWMYLYNTIGGNDWQPLNNGGGNDSIYEVMNAFPTEDIKKDVIYVIPNETGAYQCWLWLGDEGWLKISSDGAGGDRWIGTLKSSKQEQGFSWDFMDESQKRAVINAWCDSKGIAKEVGMTLSVIYSDRETATGPEPFIFRGIFRYDGAYWAHVFDMPIGSKDTIGIVKLATDSEYGDKALNVAVQPRQIKEDLESNYYKNTEVDVLLEDKADKLTTYTKDDVYTKTETDGLLKSLTKSKFVDFNPETASPAVITQYLGYTLYYGDDTKGYEVYVVDTDGTVKHVGTLKVSEEGFVLKTDEKYLALKDLRLKDDEDNPITVQTQLDGKQNAITAISALSTVLDKALTSKRVVISNDSGKLAASKITTEELDMLQGVKENIQQQIDNIETGSVSSGWVIGDVKMSMQRSNKAGDWLLCNGEAYLRSDYPDLFDVIGRSFSEPSLDAAMFRVPNMQGRVPRGVDNYSQAGSLDYSKRYVGNDSQYFTRPHLPNYTIYTDTDVTTYDGRHGHARGDFSWYSAGSHTHNIQFKATNKSGKDTYTCMSYNEDRDGRKSPTVNEAAGAHTHYKDASNGTYINSGDTSAHRHKIKLNGGVTQVELDMMQQTCNLCNYYIKWR